MALLELQEGRQAGSSPTLYSADEGLGYISTGNSPDIISVLNKLCCQIGQWWDRLFSQNHLVASEEQDKIHLQYLIFFSPQKCPRICQGGQ